MPSDEPVDRLQLAGLRITASRVTLLALVDAMPHSDVETLVRAARERLGALSVQAGYDVLRTLTEAGLVRRIEPAGSPARYESRVGDNHHHVVCRDCGAAADIDCAVGEAPCLEPTRTHGYLLDEAEVTFWGRCPDCQRRAAGGSRARGPGAPTR